MMKKKIREEEEEEEFEEESDGDEEGEVVVGQIPTVSIPRHIKKRSLKNKALSVSFNEKDLRDFVTGFHKRKKKRRKEAEKQLKEKERLKRIAARKKRKQEKEEALYGGALEDPSAPQVEPEEAGSDDGEDEFQTSASVSETKTYENGHTTITVITSELSREGNDTGLARAITKQRSTSAEKDPSLSVKKKPLKSFKQRNFHKTKKKRGYGRR